MALIHEKVLNNLDDATSLLQRRGAKYSSRPRLVMAQDILSRGMRGLTMPYGEQWQTWRKAGLPCAIQSAGLSGRAASGYREHQTLEATVLLQKILREPGDYAYHLSLFATNVVMSISYGFRVSDLEDAWVKSHLLCIKGICLALACMSPGSPMTPQRFLQWFRGDADAAYERAATLYMKLLMDVKDKMEKGVAKDCLAAYCLTEQQSIGWTHLQLAFAVSAPFGAGIDTTAGSLEAGICAILRNPAATRTAQAELDHVVGRARLPTFADEPRLPYVAAWLRELTRWFSVAPLGVPHAVTADDDHGGAHVPKGSTVVANLYSILRDPRKFPEPETFRPERFLSDDGTAAKEFTPPFGFGRRQCVGMPLAQQSLFIVLSRFLWAFDFIPAEDETGKPLLPDMNGEQTLGLTRKPVQAKFTVRVRFPEAAEILEKEVAAAEDLLQGWM
ncbi:cytochrome P450 [Epithele typhae]|uniref:cytochrome P450 n=1 Tax=Epithele typhae TaxID=378194 RepID=UPI0020078377|nr:cytochrome P450 [Epithele typhae]KAH9936845.1 cytochrome P450 [Epithele typhae]